MTYLTLHPAAARPASRLAALADVVHRWQRRRREERHLRLAVERLGSLSPHYLDDIGLGPNAGPDRDQPPRVAAGRT